MHVLLHSVPCSRPPLTHASARDSWTLTGKSGLVSCGVTAPFSWVLVCTRFCLCPLRVYFPVLYKFWQLYGGLMATSSKRAYAIPRSAAPRAPVPAAGHCRPTPPPETPGYSQASLGQSLVGSLLLSPGPGAHKVLFVPSKSLFPQFFVSSGSSMMALLVTSSKRAYAIARSAAPRVPAPAAGQC